VESLAGRAAGLPLGVDISPPGEYTVAIERKIPMENDFCDCCGALIGIDRMLEGNLFCSDECEVEMADSGLDGLQTLSHYDDY